MVQHSDIRSSVQLYEPRTFDLPALDGISSEQIAVHLKLYEGYVTAFNEMRQAEVELAKDVQKNKHALSEIRRRRSFEFDGMRMHELYFMQFEGGKNAGSETSPFARAIKNQFSHLRTCDEIIKGVGMSRGIGWTVLYYDTEAELFLVQWVGDHEIGQLAGVPILLVMDMWEHAYMVDYVPAEKEKYIDAFLRNVNWTVVEERYDAVRVS
jgi:superoxide dismutase, Fe-Mn family